MGSMMLPTQAYSLRLAKQPAPLSVLSFEGREAISETYRLAIEFTSAQAAIPVAQVLGKPASVRDRTDRCQCGTADGVAGSGGEGAGPALQRHRHGVR